MVLVVLVALALVRVRFHIIRNARIENVGKSQSCMVSKVRIVWKHRGVRGPLPDDAGEGDAGVDEQAAYDPDIVGEERRLELRSRRSHRSGSRRLLCVCVTACRSGF